MNANNRVLESGSEDQAARQVFLVCAVLGRVDPAIVARCTALPEFRVEALLRRSRELRVISELEFDVIPEPLVREILSSSDVRDIDDAHRQVLDAVAEGLRIDANEAVSMVESGCSDPRLLAVLTQHQAILHTTNAELNHATSLFARRVGVSPWSLRLARARAYLAVDRLDRCLVECDLVIASGEKAHLGEAVDLAAFAEARRGQLSRACELWRAYRPTEPHSVLFAVSTAVALGNVRDAHDFASRLPITLTSTGSWQPRLVSGLVDSLAHDQVGAVVDLMAAAHGMINSGLKGPNTRMPVLAATAAAIAAGDFSSAVALVLRCTDPDFSSREVPFASILLAATYVIGGQLDLGRQHLDAAAPLKREVPWLALAFYAVELAWARRSGDYDRLVGAWDAMQGHLSRVPVDLYSSSIVAELHVAAAVLGHGERTDALMGQVEDLLEGCGRPAIWAIHPHWCGVQAAIIRERPDMVAHHLKALGEAAEVSGYARLLADTAVVWTELLQDEFDVARVAEVVDRLAEWDLHWEAGRLAGYAAENAFDRESALVLLGKARSIEHQSDARRAEPVDRYGLTGREVVVGQLVLQGLGYREIGERLFISPRTVEHHVARIKRRLGVSSRSDMLRLLRDLLA